MFNEHTLGIMEHADTHLKGANQASTLGTLRHIDSNKTSPISLILLTSLPPKSLEGAGVTVVACWPVEDREGRPDLTRWTLARARTRHAKTLAPEACQALIAATGPDLARIADLLEQLALKAGPRPAIALDDVTALAGSSPQIQAFALAEAVSNGDTGRALGMLRALEAAGDRPEAVLPAIAFHYHRLGQALRRMGEGLSASGAAASAGVPPMFQRPFLASLERLDPERLQRSLVLLSEADVALKGAARRHAVLERLVVRLSRLAAPAPRPRR